MFKRALTFLFTLLLLSSFGNVFAKDSDVIAKGQILNLSTEAIAVGGLTYAIVPSTKFEDFNGALISIGSFAVGDYVKVKGYYQSENLIAEEIEKESLSGDDDLKNDDDDKKGNKFTGKPKLERSKLRPVAGVTTTARGNARFISKKEDKKIDRRFIINVKVPLATIPAVSPETYNQRNIFAVVTRSGLDVAKCYLAPASQFYVNYAEYKVDIRQKKKLTSLRNKKGFCIELPESESSETILPIIQDGDLIVVSDEQQGAFLEGAF